MKDSEQKISRQMRQSGRLFFNFIVIFTIFLTPVVSQPQNLLNNPQKIVVDSKRNQLLVSNFKTGDIVQIDSTNKQSYFLEDADFVDGLEIVGDTIFGIGNNRHISAYNLETKEKVMDFTFPGNRNNYLSSIVSDSAGHLFISCPFLNTIYKLRIKDGAWWIFAQNNGLNQPNGILLEREKNRIVVIDDSPKPSLIHSISLTDSSVATLASTDFKRPDGIVRDRDGNYYVGGYYLQGIYKFNPDFSNPVLFYKGSNFVYPTYSPLDNSILVTLYEINSWKRISVLTEVEQSSLMPDHFMLYQNYPNPFNPSTTIKYRLENQSFVKLQITNSVGETVSILTEGIKRSGVHEILFDADRLPSGIYFVSLINGGSIQTKKMILLK